MPVKFDNLMIVATIKKAALECKFEKDILQRLKRIYESRHERTKCDFEDSFSLICCFVWRFTKDGFDYWHKVNRQL